MAERYPGGVISKTPPVVTGPATSGDFAGEGGSASGMWTLDTVLEYEKAGAWPKPVLPRALYAWGINTNGQLGDNTTVNKSSPVQVGSLTTWSQVAAGGFMTSALKTDGTLWTWGDNSPNGQLGDGTTTDRSSPVQVGALTSWYSISAGLNHILALKNDGTLWAWGDNAPFGQLGDGTVVSKSSPVQIGALTNWYQVSGGGDHTAALKTDGTIWAWGYNTHGQVGDNTNVPRSSPVQVGALTNWSQVSTGSNHTIAIKTDGTLWTWGRNNTGQLGDNSLVTKSSPVQVGGLTNWSQASGGGSSTVAIKTDGTFWGWGENNVGQLGDNTVIRRSSPVQVGALTTWSQASTSTHVAAIKTDGTLWAWGNGGVGRLGDGTVESKSSPVQIGARTDWYQVSAGRGAHTAALTRG